MENTANEKYVPTEHWVSFATNLLLNEKMFSVEVKRILVDRGVEEEHANNILKEARIKVAEEKKSAAQKDMLWGAVWCLGGIVLTVSNIGYIFYGAIIWGGFQFFKGVSNLNS